MELAKPAKVAEVLPEWLNQLLQTSQENLTEQELNKLLDLEFVIAEMSQVNINKLRGGGNSEDILQVAASVTIEVDQINIDFIGISPANLGFVEDKQMPDAGRRLIALLAQESIDRGYDGKLSLTSLDGVFEYYKELGFTSKAGGGRMELSPKAAKKLMFTYAKT